METPPHVSYCLRCRLHVACVMFLPPLVLSWIWTSILLLVWIQLDVSCVVCRCVLCIVCCMFCSRCSSSEASKRDNKNGRKISPNFQKLMQNCVPERLRAPLSARWGVSEPWNGLGHPQSPRNISQLAPKKPAGESLGGPWDIPRTLFWGPGASFPSKNVDKNTCLSISAAFLLPTSFFTFLINVRLFFH